MRNLIILFFSAVSLFAFNSELQLFNNLFSVMFDKQKIKVYTNKYSTLGGKLEIVHSCRDADVVLGDVKCVGKPQFVLDYEEFKTNKNVIGGFYWRKGRPQLRLKKSNLEKYKLFVSQDFEEYLN